MPRNTTKDSEVSVIVDGKAKKGTIVEVISQGAARIELGDKSHIQASYSDTGEEGTFHYADETKAVRESDTFGDAPASAEPPPQAATEKPAPKSGRNK